MASIKITTGSNGKPQFTVHYRDPVTNSGRHPAFMTIDEAAYCLWENENLALSKRTAEWSGLDRSWTLRKLLYFFLGSQFSKVERNELQLSSYKKCRYDVMAIDGDILNKNIFRISHHDISSAIKPGCYRWIRSAFFLLIDRQLINFNPVEKAVRTKRKPIIIPSKSVVRQLLNAAPCRERIACWLGICGLRIGEVLALTYEDVCSDWIHIRKHIVDGVIREGLKRGVERRVRMPKELFDLLDKARIGSRDPLIANHFTGQPLSVSYGAQGALHKALKSHGIRCFHHLRHFAVSRLAEKGVDIMKISRLIGHSSIRITIDVYGHLFSEDVDMDL